MKICEDIIGLKHEANVARDEVEMVHKPKQQRYKFGWDTGLNVSEFVFLLMPLRHSATIPRLGYVIDCIEERKKTVMEEINLLNKFRAQTYRRLEHLQGIEKSYSFDGSILEREAFTTKEQR